MYCKHCGKEIDDDSKYCRYCGGVLYIKPSKIDTAKKCVNSLATQIKDYITEQKITESDKPTENNSTVSVKMKNSPKSDINLEMDNDTAGTVKEDNNNESLIKETSNKPNSPITTSKNDMASSIKDEKEDKAKVTPYQFKYDFGVYAERYHNNDSLDDVYDSFIAALKNVGIIAVSIFTLLLCFIYLRAIALGWILTIASASLTYFYIKKYRRRKDTKDIKQKRSTRYYVCLSTFTIFLFFICFLALRVLIVQTINELQPEKTTTESVSQSDLIKELNAFVLHTEAKLPILLNEYVTWTNARITKEGLVLNFSIDDANFDIYKIDFADYKGDFENILNNVSNGSLLKLCVETKKPLILVITSQWDVNKVVRELHDPQTVIAKGVQRQKKYQPYNTRRPLFETNTKEIEHQMNNIKKQVRDLPSENDRYY